MNRKQIMLSRRELMQAAACAGLTTMALSCAPLTQTEARSLPARGIPDNKANLPSNQPLVVGYYPDWSPIEPAQLAVTAYSHICHAFARFDKNGILRFPEEAHTNTLIASAHAGKTQVLLSIGGMNSGITLRAQPADAFADNLAKRVQDYHYDGIDLDWEFLESEEDGTKLANLVQALRKRLGHSLLTMAVSAGDYYGRWFKTDALLPAIDWLNIMTYDFSGPWSNKVLHNAPLPQVTAAVDYWTGRGWPTQKLLLGIPNYGRRIHAGQFGGPAPAGTYEEAEIAFKDIPKYLSEGWKPKQDADALVPYLLKAEGDELITYDDEASARRKGQLACTRNLRGFFFWEITSDFDGKTHLMARAAREGWDAAAPPSAGRNPS